MAIPVVESFTTNKTASGSPSSTLTLTKPSGVTSGDLLLVFITNDDTTNTAQWDGTNNNPRLTSDNSDAGFTFFYEGGNSNSDAHIGAFWRVADGTEESTLYVQAQSSDDQIGWYIRVSGADTTTPINVQNDPDTTTTVNSTTHTVPSVNTSADNCLAFYLLALDSGTPSSFTVSGTGWSESDDQEIGAANSVASTWGTKSQASAGATGDATVTSTITNKSHYFQFAVNEAAAAGITRSPGTGSLQFTGNAPSPEIDHYRDVGVGSIQFTRYAPTLQTNHIQTPGIDELQFTRYQPTVEIDHYRDVGTDALQFTGNAPTLDYTWVVFPSTKTLQITGYEPTIVVGGSKIASMLVGSHQFTGAAPTVEIDHFRDVGVRAMQLTGYAPTVEIDHYRDVGARSVQITGYAPTLNYSWTVRPSIRAMQFTGYAPTVEIDHFRDVGAAALQFTGNAPTAVGSSGGNTVNPSTGTISFDGRGATGGVRQRPIGPSGGWGVGLAFVRYAPTVFAGGYKVDVPAGSIQFTPGTPSAEIDHFRDVGPDSLLFTTYQPEVLAGAGKIIGPNKGSITFAGYAPSAEIDHIRDLGTGSIAFSTSSPNVVTTPYPATASLQLAGYAPTVNINHYRDIGTASLQLTGYVPTTNAIVFDSSGSLILTGQSITKVDVANSGTSITNPNTSTDVPSNYETCDYTGFRQLPGSLKMTWSKYSVRRKSYEERHPQDRIRYEPERPRGSKRPEKDDRFIEDIGTVDPDDL